MCRQNKNTSPFYKGIHPEGFFLKESERDFNRESERGEAPLHPSLPLSFEGSALRAKAQREREIKGVR